MKLSETRPLPAEIGAPESILKFLGAVASRLAPGLEDSIGEVRWTRGDASGVDWVTDGYLSDGTNVRLSIRLPDRTISLVVDTAPILRFAPEPGLWTNLGLAGTVAIGIAVGFSTGRFVWGIVCTLSIVGVWMAIDVAKQARDERAAAARTFDEEPWRTRLSDALNAARTATMALESSER